MKKKERRTSSFDHLMRKTHWKLSVYKPSYTVFALILMGVAIFLLGGGVYDILMVENPPYPYPYYIYWMTQTGKIIFFHPGPYPGGFVSLQYQLVGGSIIVMSIYALGTLGLLMTYQSVRHAYKPRQAAILLVVGLALLLVAFMLVESILYNNKIYFYKSTSTSP